MIEYLIFVVVCTIGPLVGYYLRGVRDQHYLGANLPSPTKQPRLEPYRTPDISLVVKQRDELLEENDRLREQNDDLLQQRHELLGVIEESERKQLLVNTESGVWARLEVFSRLLELEIKNK